MVREPEICEVHYVDEDRVEKVRASMVGDEVGQALSEIFKVLGDPTRVKILHALAREELCVCDIAALLGMSLPAISHHLRVLRNLRLVRHRKAGRIVYYSLDDDHVKKLLEVGIEHARE
jgi:ArsR family transcriptional regulator